MMKYYLLLMMLYKKEKYIDDAINKQPTQL